MQREIHISFLRWKESLRILLLFFLILVRIPVSNPSYGIDFYFHNITFDKGIYNSIVYKAVQDKDGVMWFALRDGIDKYNGYNFKHYDLISSDFPHASTSPLVRYILKDEQENLWAISNNGLFQFDYLKDDFRLVLTDLRERFPVDFLTVFYKDKESTIYIGANNGIVIYDIEKDSVYSIPDFNPRIFSIAPKDESNLWIGTGSGLYLYSKERKQFISQTKNPVTNDRLAQIVVFSYLPYDEEHFLLGTRAHGLLLLDHVNGDLKKIKLNKSKDLSFSIRDIIKYNEKILIGTDGAGLMVLGADLEFESSYILDEDVSGSLSNNGIYDLFTDEDNRLWITTYGGGINLFDPHIKPFKLIQHQQNNPNSLISNMSRSIVEDSRHNLWFGTEYGISILNRETRNYSHIRFASGSDNDLAAKGALCMIRDDKDHIWIGTFSGGIDIYDENAVKINSLRHDPNNSNSLATDHIYTLFQDRDGDVWAGGIRGGTTRITLTENRYQRFDNLNNVQCITGDSKNRILVGTLDGLFYSDDKVNFNRFQGFKKDSSQFINRIFCIVEDSKGRLWIGSEGEGLSKIDLMKGTQTNYDIEDGLPSNIVYGIAEDEAGNLWLSTTNGISRFNPVEEEFKNFTSSDNLPSNEFNYGAYYVTDDGNIIFGGNRGFTMFQPTEIRENEKPSNIIFTNFYIFNKENKHSEYEEQRLNVNETGSITLKNFQNSFTIEFAAINYTSPEKALYRWKMEGLEQYEESWTENAVSRTASFTALQPGNYIFHVQASNNDGYWNTSGRTIRIIIQPPFWKTTLAKVFYVLLSLIIIFLIQRYIYLYFKEKNAFEKIRFFINIAHDIRTPLTLIKAPVEDLIKNVQKGTGEYKNLQLIANNTNRLNNLINQLLDFQKADLNKIKLKVSSESLTFLVKSIISNFESLAHKSNKSLIYGSNSEEISGYFDRFILERVMYNLVSNAIKYSKPGGKIVVSLDKSGDYVVISVSDQGIGIARDQQKHIFKRYYRSENIINSKIAGSGVGLMLTKRLIELHRGEITFTSKEGEGTTFYVRIPVSIELYNNEEVCSPVEMQMEEDDDVARMGSLEAKELPQVLITEDSDELREFLRDKLSKYYQVSTASTGKEGLNIVNQNQPDLIISDIMMPEMDGVEFCTKIRNNLNTSHIPFILLTALNSMQDKIKGIEYGADDYIEKPFDIEYLKVRIDNLLQSRESLKKKYLNQPDKSTLSEIRSQPDRDLMTRAYEVVGQHYHDCEFSVEQFCKIMGVSRPVLYRKLKAYSDLSPQDFIKLIRLKKAEELLFTSAKSIKEIAYEVGFSDPRYFSVSFKKYFGKSPKEFVKS